MKIKQNIISKLIFLCFVTTIIATTISASKYTNTIVASNSTKIAAFVVEAEGSGNNNIELNCNTNQLTANYNITVTNNKNNKIAEVGMKYNIIIEFSQALPTEMQISLLTNNASKTYNGGQTTYTFENVGEFAPETSKNITHTLGLTTSTSIKDNYNGTFKIFVHAEQIN